MSATPFNLNVPIYHQIAQLLRQRVKAGELGPDGRHATEEALCSEFGVSRTTIRKALGDLKREGLLKSRRGVGTRRVEPGHSQALVRSSGDPLHALLATKSRVVALEKTAAPERISTFLELPPDHRALRIVRTHELEGAPLSVVISYLPIELGELVTRSSLASRPLHEMVLQCFGQPLRRSVHAVRVARADTQIANLLKIALADPVLYIQSSAFLADGRPVRWTDNYFREDRYEYIAEIDWPPLAGASRKRD